MILCNIYVPLIGFWDIETRKFNKKSNRLIGFWDIETEKNLIKYQTDSTIEAVF